MTSPDLPPSGVPLSCSSGSRKGCCYCLLSGLYDDIDSVDMLCSIAALCHLQCAWYVLSLHNPRTNACGQRHL